MAEQGIFRLLFPSDNLDVSDQSKNKKPRKEIEIKPEAVAVVGEDSDPVIKAVPIVGE